MYKLPFMEKVEQYKKENAEHINKKNSAIKDLQKKVDNKQKEIDIKQAEYNSKPSDDLFEELLTLKRELEGLKINVKSAGEIIQIPPTKQVDPNEVTKEVKEAIEKLDIKKYSDAILKAKENYLNSVDAFLDKTKELRDLSKELDQFEVGVSFTDIFKSYRNIYYADSKAEINAYEADNIVRKLLAAQSIVNSTFINKK